MTRDYSLNARRNNRQSLRLKNYDYSQVGAYFTTVCTRDRECLFGKVVDGQMQLFEAGRIVQAEWEALPQLYDGIESAASVVMPNHVHGVVLIGTAVGAIHESPLPPESSVSVRMRDRRRMLLSKIVGRFKMVTAKQINLQRGSPGLPVWQRNVITTNTSFVTWNR